MAVEGVDFNPVAGVFRRAIGGTIFGKDRPGQVPVPPERLAYDRERGQAIQDAIAAAQARGDLPVPPTGGVFGVIRGEGRGFDFEAYARAVALLIAQEVDPRYPRAPRDQTAPPPDRPQLPLPEPPPPVFGGVRLPSIWEIIGAPSPSPRPRPRPRPRRRPKPKPKPRRRAPPRPRPPPDVPVPRRGLPPLSRVILRGLGGVLGGILWPTEMGDTGPPPPPPPRPPEPPRPEPPRAPPPPRPQPDQEEQRDVIGVWPEEEIYPEEGPIYRGEDNEQSPEEEDEAERDLDRQEGRRPAPAPAPAPAPLPAPRPSLPPIVIQLPSWQELATEYLRLRERRQRAPARQRAPEPTRELAPAFQPGSMIQSLTSSNARRAECEARCREAARRKRKRKERAVCYSGTFTETRRGTIKRRRRKVPCK